MLAKFTGIVPVIPAGYRTVHRLAQTQNGTRPLSVPDADYQGLNATRCLLEDYS